jgi:serine/threonine protein kinase
MLVVELLEGSTLAERIAQVWSMRTKSCVSVRPSPPRSIMRTRREWRDGIPRLLDFGLAGVHGDAVLAGTPAYLSPEAILGAPASVSDDVWSTAVMLYEAFTAHHPFVAATSTVTMNPVLGSAVPAPDSFRPNVPPALAAALMRALLRDPRERICTARELREVLVGP